MARKKKNSGQSQNTEINLIQEEKFSYNTIEQGILHSLSICNGCMHVLD